MNTALLLLAGAYTLASMALTGAAMSRSWGLSYFAAFGTASALGGVLIELVDAGRTPLWSSAGLLVSGVVLTGVAVVDLIRRRPGRS